jgi:hypothetical protein
MVCGQSLNVDIDAGWRGDARDLCYKRLISARRSVRYLDCDLIDTGFAWRQHSANDLRRNVAEQNRHPTAAGAGGIMDKTPIAGTDAVTVKAMVSKGKGKMKPLPAVTGDGLENVAAYVASLKK